MTDAYCRAKAAVQACRPAGELEPEARHALDMTAYSACQAAGVSIAAMRVQLWREDRQRLIRELTARFIQADTDEVPPV